MEGVVCKEDGNGEVSASVLAGRTSGFGYGLCFGAVDAQHSTDRQWMNGGFLLIGIRTGRGVLAEEYVINGRTNSDGLDYAAKRRQDSVRI